MTAHRPTRRRQRVAASLAVATVLMTSAGCDGATPTRHAAPRTSPAATSPLIPPRTVTSTTASRSSDVTVGNAPDPGPMVTVATATVSRATDSVTTTYAVGPPGPSSAFSLPAGMLADCGWDTPSTLSTVVFIHGRLTVTYRGGVDQLVTFTGGDVTVFGDGRATPVLGHTVVESTGDTSDAAGSHGWTLCDGGATTDELWSRPMSPGQTVTLDMWIGVPGAVGTLTAADDDALQLELYPVAADQIRQPSDVLTLSGRGGATCDDPLPSPHVFLYATVPHTFEVSNAPVPTISCRPFVG